MKIKTMITSLAIGIAGLIGINSTLYTVDETNQAVITQMGKPIRVVKQAGLYAKTPLIQSVHYFDKRYLEYGDVPRETTTADKTMLEIDNYALWKITDPLKFMQTVRTENGAQTRLDDVIFSLIRTSVGKNNLIEIVRNSNKPLKTTELTLEGGEVTAEEVKTGREKIMNYITEECNKATQEYGVEVKDVRMMRAEYVKENKLNVFKRMKAERNRIAAKYRSEGEGEKLRILGTKEKEEKRILSEAYKKSKEIEGKADAEATKIYAEAFQKDPELYNLLRTLEFYKKTLGDKSTLVLSTDSEYFRLLTEKGKVK
ncbi:protease modulator HflC [Candidatus Woesearchaeota archaeon]|nr:protease modulator HflC [Candidatus Woesearchaeota archaeon]